MTVYYYDEPELGTEVKDSSGRTWVYTSEGWAVLGGTGTATSEDALRIEREWIEKHRYPADQSSQPTRPKSENDKKLMQIGQAPQQESTLNDVKGAEPDRATVMKIFSGIDPPSRQVEREEVMKIVEQYVAENLSHSLVPREKTIGEVVSKMYEEAHELGKDNPALAAVAGFGAGVMGAILFPAVFVEETVRKGPVEAVRETVEGIIDWIKNIPSRVMSGDPVELGTLAGEVVGGALLGKAVGKVAGPPLSKAKVQADIAIGKIKGEYVEPEIKFVESFTYEPATVEVLAKQVATGEKQTLVHMTRAPEFDVKPGESIILEGKPELATGFRKEFDALHWYQSAPSPTGEPLGYLAYVGIGETTGETITKFVIREPKAQAIITKDVVEFVKPLEGETFAEYQVRTGQMSGKTIIPGENVFGYSTERQVITPAKFESSLVEGLEYPGTKLTKVEDIGWTYYRQITSPELEGTFLQKLGYGEKYHKIYLSEWEKSPIEANKVVEGAVKEKVLDLAKYNEEYGRVKYVSAGDIVSEVGKTTSAAASAELSRSYLRSLEQSEFVSSPHKEVSSLTPIPPIPEYSSPTPTQEYPSPVPPPPEYPSPIPPIPEYPSPIPPTPDPPVPPPPPPPYTPAPTLSSPTETLSSPPSTPPIEVPLFRFEKFYPVPPLMPTFGKGRKVNPVVENPLELEVDFEFGIRETGSRGRKKRR